MTMYIQVGQSEGDFMRQVQETYFVTPDFLSPPTAKRSGSVKAKDSFSKLFASNGHQQQKQQQRLTTTNNNGGGSQPAVASSTGRRRSSVHYKQSASRRAIGALGSVCACICRCLRDNRIKKGNAKTVETFNRINMRTDRYKCLERILNFMYLLIGILLFIGVLLALIHAFLVTSFGINVLYMAGITSNSTTNLEFTFVLFSRSIIANASIIHDTFVSGQLHNLSAETTSTLTPPAYVTTSADEYDEFN